VRRVGGSRRFLVDLLRRRPALDRGEVPPAEAAGLRRVDQVREVLDLVDRGLLSEEEFEKQHGKPLDPP
jgi:hypothetical protein